MYGGESSRKSTKTNQNTWPRGAQDMKEDFARPHIDPRNRSSSFYPSKSTYTQREVNLQQNGGRMQVDHQYNNATTLPQQRGNMWGNNVDMFSPGYQNSYYHNRNNSIYNQTVAPQGFNAIYNSKPGSYENNPMPYAISQGNNSIYSFKTGSLYNEGNTNSHAVYQSQRMPHANYGSHTLQQNTQPCSSVDRNHGHFQPNNVPLYSGQVSSSKAHLQTSISQEDADKVWLKNWLEQHHIQSPVTVNRKTLKISEAQNLFQHYLSLNNQLKQEHEELQKNIESERWNDCLAKTEKTMEEIVSVQNTLIDPDNIEDLDKKIHKRKQKRLWLKNSRRRRYLEKQEDEERRKVLHEKIDLWQKEISDKDLAARKAASLKHEAGGVLGEVRRKLQDCHKLQELIRSLVKLRELRKSEGEKKGVYPKTSSSEDKNFTARCEYVDKMVEERIKTYAEEEKALRVIIMEEEGERKKKEKQQRLEQKALLNLSKEDDPLAEFRRFYEQADESIQYLVRIRRDWDMYLTPDITLGSRVPDEDITAGPPSSSLWASVLEAGDQSEKME